MKNTYLQKLRSSLSNNKNERILKLIIDDLAKYVSSKNKVLDIASDKDPVFSALMARIFTESNFVHFRDNEKLLPRIHKKYSAIPNLEITYSAKDLNPPYDLGIAFLTLHELKNPAKSLKQTYQKLRNNGKILIIDYDLGWFPKLAKKQNWDNANLIINFKDYVFTTNNERKVLKEESNCMKNHSRKGIEDYIKYAEKAGFVTLDSKSHVIETPWGEKPKYFSYVGEKIN